jgi:EAL domain-containing protein (putative c-di-GMP-specific phosphodiesterase class I)
MQDQRLSVIRGMIDSRALETYFQPIVDLRSGEVVGTEALSRFAQVPVRPPDAWFAEAATLGLGVELELAAVARALERLDRLPSGMYLSLNASVEAIMSDNFHAAMSDVPAERIVLELTEHTQIADYSSFNRTVESLRSVGMRLAVDDAGSGFASFNHVLNLAPDVIKLDISLIRGIDHDPAKQALARALLRFGSEAFGTTFVAEGIETKGELGTVQSLGFHSGQGFILGRPSRHAGPVGLVHGASDSADPRGTPAPMESDTTTSTGTKPDHLRR